MKSKAAFPFSLSLYIVTGIEERSSDLTLQKKNFVNAQKKTSFWKSHQKSIENKTSKIVFLSFIVRSSSPSLCDTEDDPHLM